MGVEYEIRLVGFYDELEDKNPKPGQGQYLGRGTSSGSPDEAFIVTYLDADHGLMDVMEGTSDVIAGRFKVGGGSSTMSDGLWVWRADLARYVEHHHVRLPTDFAYRIRRLNYRMPPEDPLLDPGFRRAAHQATGWA